MKTQYRVIIYILKQYGFSDIFLLWLFENYRNEDIPKIIFTNEYTLNPALEGNITKHDIELINSNKFIKFLSRKRSELINYFYEYPKSKIIFKFDRTILDRFMPENIKPLFFYLRGSEEILDSKNLIGIVGTRNIDRKYEEKIPIIVKKYVEKDFVIISGLAHGTDTEVHEETLKFGGKTIAVLPTNFNKIYPKENEKLAKKIFTKGLAISAVGPLENTYKSNFLTRNNYVAHLSSELFVIQTGKASGTMNTIRNAIRLNKKVSFLDQHNEELNNYLLKLGCKMVNF
ncbi:DNA-processing protein DprA [Pediococcus pentosaceus]|uniref:DNA-processing protein DprA n=1 Tax=Pediococcus pentosaceus TaxID=1255 RepID=UPI0013637446|nr:DNA-processing protein DprA [Pediococcus pentosaceus]QHM64396.1 DNA processing protein DprA [Pediococcus pentosaceus]QHM66114.1 DNA processing protein DprA [Pediococcus pentosaceus]QHM67985.1 DNA processing protein DprA [Pediococcus pentosaceus]